jgi:BMFP domain-containing protein YqiC
MQSGNRLMDDLARVANGALSAAAGIREELEQVIRQQFERYLAERDLVTREEFEAARDMAAKARATQEALERRVADLEARLANATTAKPKAQAPVKRRKVKEEATSTKRRANAARSSAQNPGQNADSET